MAFKDLWIKFKGDSSSVVKAANRAADSIDEVGAVSAATAQKQNQLDQAMAKINKRFGVIITKSGRLRNAQGQYTKATKTLTAALKQQGISLDALQANYKETGVAVMSAADQMEATARAAQRAGQQLGTASARAKKLGTQQKSAAMHTANLGAQLNDIGVMLAAGQNPFQLAIQQGTQINQVFQRMGTGTAALKAMWVALKSLIGPTQLVTLGLIVLAGYAARAAKKFFKFGEGAKELKEAIEGIKESTKSLNEELGVMQQGLDNVEQFRIQQKINKLLDEREEVMKSITGEETLSQSYIVNRKILIEGEIAKLHTLLEENKKVTKAVETTTARLETMKKIMEQTSFSSQLMRQLDVIQVKSILIGAAIGRWVDGVNAFVTQSQAVSGKNKAGQIYGGRGVGRQGPTKGDITTNPFFGTIPTHDPKKTKGGGSAGKLDAVREALSSEKELQMQAFAEQQDVLKTALEKQLLTRQEYNQLTEAAQKQHAERMLGLDDYRYGTGLQKTEHFLGSMAQSLQGGNEQMLKIAKTFGAAQALISAWQGAAEALKLPFPANLAAFAQVLATGMGAVSAIKGVTKGGGSSGSAGAASAAPALPPRMIDFNIQGGGEFMSRQTVIQLVGEINKAGEENGVRIRMV